MSDFFQLVIAGLATGAIYALAAIGFTLLWQTSQTINFAQGEFVMLPAFFALIAMKGFDLPFWLAALIAVAASMLVLGLVFKKLDRRPADPAGRAAAGHLHDRLGLLLKDGVKEFYSAEAQPFPTICRMSSSISSASRSRWRRSACSASPSSRSWRCNGSSPARRPAARCRRRRRTRPSRASSACRSSA